MSFCSNNHSPHRLLVSHDRVTRQVSAASAGSARLLLLSRGHEVPRRKPVNALSKDIDVSMPMRVHYRVSLSASSITAGEGRLLDLSAEGCRIEGAHYLPVNTYLSLRLIISPKEMPVLVDLAAVRWTRGTVCGIHFLSLQPLQIARLKTFLASAAPQNPPNTPDKG